MDFTKMSADEIREELEKLGLSEDEANQIKGKSNLINKMKELKGNVVSTDELNAEPDNSMGEVTQEDSIPPRTSPLWHEYVMSKFSEDELVQDPNSKNKLPNVDGLRRVTEMLIGPILVSEPDPIKAPCENDKNSTVKYRIEIYDNAYSHPLRFGGVADAHYGNVDGDYKRHLSSIAETRAEARALRKALGLKKIVAAEEVVSPPSADDFNPEEFITDMQIIVIDKGCKESDISVLKFINSGSRKYEDIRKIPKNASYQMVSYINEYSRGAVPIPDSIKGYDANWRN